MGVKTFTLDNGMQVLLKENRSSPVISFNALVKVGSASETDAEAGMSHVIEHMLFKGTPTQPVGAIAREVEASGGEINAYTSFDQTVYYINMATRFADRGLAILADALQHPLFDEQELESEKEVILEEIRRDKDNPGRIVSEGLFRRAYERHPYGRPIIGFPQTVKSFTRQQLLEFYNRWYVPKNIAFIVVGDFETDTMLEQLRRAFAHFEGAEPPARPMETLVEPPQKELRLVVETMNVQSCYLSMGYHVPAIINTDVPALDLLSHILGGTESSRLEQIVKEKKHLVHHVSCYSFTPMDPGMMAISAVLNEKNVYKAVAAIREEVESLQVEPVLVSELSRAKINMRSAEIYERETVGGEAGKLATFLSAAGTHEFENRYYQMLMDVHADEIRQAARTYLTSYNCTLSLVVPKGSSLTKKKQKIASIVKKQTKTSRKIAKRIPSPIKEFKLKGGLKVIVKEDHNLPLVAMCAAAKGGTRFETKDNNGVSELTARLMTKGTKVRSAVAIAEDIEKIAGYVDGFTGRNTIGAKSKFLSDHVRSGVELFCDILSNPLFDSKEVEKEKRLQLQAIKDQEDALASVAFLNLLRTLFPKHPYGFRSLGEIASVRKLNPAIIKRHYHDILRRSGTVISVVGDVSPKEILELLEQNLEGLSTGKVKHPKILANPKLREVKKIEVVKKGKQQAHIVVGFPGTKFSDPDRYALAVLNNVLVGQGGRLFLELRDRMGLAYSVSSMNVEGIDPGYFAVYIGTEPAKINRALNGIKTELNKIISKRVSKDEIERSKQYLVGTHELESQRIMTLASLYTFNELYGLGVKEVGRYTKKILSVTRERILRVAKKYIDLDAYVLSIVKPD